MRDDQQAGDLHSIPSLGELFVVLVKLCPYYLVYMPLSHREQCWDLLNSSRYYQLNHVSTGHPAKGLPQAIMGCRHLRMQLLEQGCVQGAVAFGGQ